MAYGRAKNMKSLKEAQRIVRQQEIEAEVARRYRSSLRLQRKWEKEEEDRQNSVGPVKVGSRGGYYYTRVSSSGRYYRQYL